MNANDLINLINYVNDFHFLGSQGVKKPHRKTIRAWELYPEICLSVPLPSNQRYDLKQVSSHLGTQSP